MWRIKKNVRTAEWLLFCFSRGEVNMDERNEGK